MTTDSARRPAWDRDPATLCFDSHILDLERGALFAGTKEIALRPKTFDVLRYLASNPGRLVGKDELMAAVWPHVIVGDDSIVQCVKELRRALGDHDQRVIRTVPRRGYRFEAAVSAEPPGGAPRPSEAPDGSAQSGSVPPLSVADMRQRRGDALAVGIVLILAVIATATAGAWWYGMLDGRADAPPLSIVVLPFQNLGDDPDQEHLADGVSNDLSTELSRIPGMFVIAHASARTFKGTNANARQIGRDLNVRYLLEGSLRRNGESVRINVQLISARTGAAVWGERFERRHDRLAAWQDEVVGRVAIALNFELTRLESERSLREGRGNPQAFDLVAQGWALVYAAKRPDKYAAARALFREAVELDPEAVNALAGIGWTSAIVVLDGWSDAPEQDIAEAQVASVRALELEPNHFVAHHVRGFLMRLQTRPSAARDAFRTAIAINPNFAPGHAQLGATELELGRPEATIPAVERAMKLSPRDPSLGPWLAIVGMANLHLARYQEAVSLLTRAIDTGTPVARHHAYLASAFALAGRLPEAADALAMFREMAPSATVATVRANARSVEAGFVSQQELFLEGLRLAGLPE